MTTAGIIGGIGPESTIDYYRLIIAGYRERMKGVGYPSIVINSVDLDALLVLLNANRLEEMTAVLTAEIRRLASAGADFALLAANTPHIVFDALAAASPIPLISIVETARAAARSQGLKRLGLLGTRFTMQGRFYLDPFRAAGMELVVPDAAEQALIHDKYLNELIPGVFRPETRRAFAAIIARLKAQEKIDGLILAGTELPLLLREAEDPGIPSLDTTKLHVARVVELLVS
jgi:aspartate racemase